MSSRELLFSVTKKDFEVTWFSGSGAGGQHRNKHKNCCRLFHPASGARATGQEERTRPANQRRALERLVRTPRFRSWHAAQLANMRYTLTVEQEVQRMMRPENLRVEVRNKDGQWETEDGR